ncbi:MAG: hypothetical protein HC772_02125 [Leptolyngbyaceae cyanobacterium CRU_2_3]|nr:hypothetical protein [Leptolyngbyaceae cyanobacterium CRU_2_3]
MRHPFELELSDLENVQLEVEQILTPEEAEKVTGGRAATTLALGEEGGIFPPIRPIKPPIYTTLAIGEEGGGLDYL